MSCNIKYPEIKTGKRKTTVSRLVIRKAVKQTFLNKEQL